MVVFWGFIDIKAKKYRGISVVGGFTFLEIELYNINYANKYYQNIAVDG